MVSKLHKWAFIKACSKMAPNRIFMSGPECEKNDFYTIRIPTEGNPNGLVLVVNGSLITILEGEGKEPSTVAIDDVDMAQIEITHYLHNFYTTYDGIDNFISHCLSKKDVVKVKSLRIIQKLSQKIFNKKVLHSKPRHELLEYIVENYGVKNKEFGLISLMSDIYSIRSFGHPDKDKCLDKLRLYLSSLSESGEITKGKQSDHRVTGKAIVTLEAFQNDERRHKDSVRLQYTMVVITIFLAFLASIQAGLVKLKPLIDLTQ